MSDKLSHLRHNFWISKTLFSTSQIEFNTINKTERPLHWEKWNTVGKSFISLKNKTKLALYVILWCISQ